MSVTVTMSPSWIAGEDFQPRGNPHQPGIDERFVRHLSKQAWDVHFKGKLLVSRSMNPARDAARALIRHEAIDPDAELIIRVAASDAFMCTTLRAAAQLSPLGRVEA